MSYNAIQSAQTLRQLISSFQHETSHTPDWYAHEKHIFVFSWTGKPIFTRHGDDNKLVEIIGTMSAFITNYAEMLGQPLVSFQAGAYTFVVLDKSPLFLFCIHRTVETVSQVLLQLSLLYYQLISVLTYRLITNILDSGQYDPRNELGGTDLVTHALLNAYESNFDLLTQTLPTFRLHKSTRVKILNALKKFKMKESHILFTAIICNGKIVGLVKGTTSSPIFNYDLLILINTIINQPSLRTNESWTPICLPFANKEDHYWVYSRFFSTQFSDKIYDAIAIAQRELEHIYSPSQQQLQGIYTKSLHKSSDCQFATSNDSASRTFTQQTDICLLTISTHLMLFDRCQQHSQQLLQYLEKNSGEVRMNDYLASFVVEQLAPLPATILDSSSASDMEFSTATVPDPTSTDFYSSTLPSPPPPSTPLTTPILPIQPSPSFTHVKLAQQNVHNDSYLFDQIRLRCRNQLAQRLEAINKSSISLLQELHYSTLSTSTSIIFPGECDQYDPKYPPPYITAQLPAAVPQKNEPISPAQTPLALQLQSDLSHFVYIDTKTASIIDSEALKPYRYLTKTGISIQTPTNWAPSPLSSGIQLNQPLTSSTSSVPTSSSSELPITTPQPASTLQPPSTKPAVKLSVNVPASPGLANPQPSTPTNHLDEHFQVISTSRAFDTHVPSVPFKLGGHGAICVTTTRKNGLFPETDPTSLLESHLTPSLPSPRSNAQQNIEAPPTKLKALHDHDFTRIPIAPCATYLNTLAGHASVIDRYKLLHTKTHRYNHKITLDVESIDEIKQDPHLLNQNTTQYGLVSYPTTTPHVLSKRPYMSTQTNTHATPQEQKMAFASDGTALVDPIVFNYMETTDSIIVYQSKPGLYELYCTFPPLTSKESIANSLHRVVVYFSKNGENYFNRVITV